MKKVTATMALCLLLTACSGGDSSLASEGSSLASEGSSLASGNSSESSEGGYVDGDNQTDTKKSNVQEVTEKYDSDFESCKNASYINLDWTNASKCPVNSVSEIYNLQYDGEVRTIETISQKDRLELFKEYCIFYFGEYLDECAFFDCTELNAEREEISADGITYRAYYRIPKFQSELENETVKISWLIYRNIEKKQYLWWADTTYPHWINRGETITALADNEFKFTSWIPSDTGEPIARYYNDGKSDSVTYKLSDGEMSIGDAIKYVTKEYGKSLPYEDIPEYYVRYVDVYKMDNETYAYLLMTTTMYNGIPFEQGYEMKTTSILPNYFTEYGQAMMMKKNDIDTTLWCCPETELTPVGSPVEEIVSLKEAADIVSQKMSQNVKFDVISTELIYHGTTSLLKPTWLFTLCNTNDDLYYNVYVDAEAGTVRYYSYGFE